MTVDVRASTWNLSLEILDSDFNVIGGPYDYSSAALDIEITFPEIRANRNINTYLPWTATVTLLDGIDGFNVDNRDTAGNPTGAALLAMENRVTIDLDGQRSWPPMYILRTPDPATLDQSNIKLELGDITQISNIKQPENDYSGITLGTSVSPSQVINSIASNAGFPTSSDTITTGYNLSAPVGKNTTRSWPSEIGEIAACNTHAAWIDSTGALRLTAIDLDKTAPDFSVTIGVDEAGGINSWVPQNFAERPPGKLEVIGGGGTARVLPNPEVINRTIQGDGYTALTSTQTKTINAALGAPDTTIEYEERQAELQIRPTIATVTDDQIDEFTDNTETALRDSEGTETNRRYNGITKALTRETATKKQARGLAGGDAYRDTEGNAALTVITTSEKVTDYEYDSVTGLVKSRTISDKKPWCLWRWGKVRPANYNLDSNRFLDRDNFTQTTTWTRVLDQSGDPTIEAWEIDQVTKRPRGELYPEYSGANPDTLVVDPREDQTFKIRASDGSTAPPKTIYQEPLYVRDETQFSGSVQITPLSGNAHKLTEETIKVQAPVIVSSRQCSVLADFYAKWQHGLSLGWSLIIAVPPEILTNFEPAMRVDVTFRGLTTAYFMNGFTILGDGEETLFGCNLGEIGVVGVTPDVVSPQFIVQQFAVLVGGATIGGSMASGPPDQAVLTGGAVAGGTLIQADGAFLTGGAVAGGVLESGEDTELIGGAVAGGTMESGFTELIGGAVAGGALFGGAAKLVGGALAGGVLESGAQSDVDFSNVQLLLHMEGANGSTTFSDSSNAARVPTVNSGTTITTAQFKYGSASGDFDGGTSSLEYADSADFTASGDFCFEMFVRGTDWASTDGGANRALLTLGNSLTASAPGLLLDTGGEVLLFNGSTRITSAAMSLNTWHHVAWYRVSGIHYIAIDGVVDSETYSNSTEINPALLRIGASISNVGNFEGQIDEVRYVVDESPYGSSDFTPPTGPHPDS